jgi:hypothetical protein
VKCQQAIERDLGALDQEREEGWVTAQDSRFLVLWALDEEQVLASGSAGDSVEEWALAADSGRGGSTHFGDMPTLR